MSWTPTSSNIQTVEVGSGSVHLTIDSIQNTVDPAVLCQVTSLQFCDDLACSTTLNWVQPGAVSGTGSYQAVPTDISTLGPITLYIKAGTFYDAFTSPNFGPYNLDLVCGPLTTLISDSQASTTEGISQTFTLIYGQNPIFVFADFTNSEPRCTLTYSLFDIGGSSTYLSDTNMNDVSKQILVLANYANTVATYSFKVDATAQGGATH